MEVDHAPATMGRMSIPYRVARRPSACPHCGEIWQLQHLAIPEPTPEVDRWRCRACRTRWWHSHD